MAKAMSTINLMQTTMKQKKCSLEKLRHTFLYIYLNGTERIWCINS